LVKVTDRTLPALSARAVTQVLVGVFEICRYLIITLVFFLSQVLTIFYYYINSFI